MGGILHVVQIQFKPEVDGSKINEILENLRGLKQACVSSTTGKPYIVSVSAGADNSPEGLQNGYTHMFVAEFGSAEDRDYYVNKDPKHQALTAGLPPFLKALQVLDIEK